MFSPQRRRSTLNIEKAKDKARKFEQKDQIDQAIAQYTKIVEALEGTAELDSELAVFNKLGDLHLRVGNVTAGVEMYERAANRYADSGFPNNAIALCNKILRASPGRTPVYLRLAKLMVERGLVAEAKRNLLEYAQRMQQAGQLEQAFTALKEFADLSPNSEEIRLLLAEQLKAAARTDEAREQLAKLYAEVEASGDERRARTTVEKMKAIDPDFDAESEPKMALKKKKTASSDLIFINLDEPVAVEEPAAAPAPAPEPAPEPEAEDEELLLEPTALAEEVRLDEEVVGDPGLMLEPTSLVEEPEAPEVPALEVETTSLVEDEPVEEIAPPPALERTSLVEMTVDDVPEVEELEIERTSIAEPAPDEVEQLADVESTEFTIETEEPVSVELDVKDDEADADLEVDLDIAELDVGAEIGSIEVGAESSLDVPDLELDEEEAVELEEEEEVEDEEPAVVAGKPDKGGGFDLGAALASDLEDEPVTAAMDVDAIEAQVAEDPSDPGLHRRLAEALMEKGQRERGLEELDVAITLYEEQEDWANAENVADEAIRLDPNSVKHHQKRVEYSYRRGDKGQLLDAYLGLADALFRDGSTDRARAVYKRVLERDPDNERALLALETLEPTPEEAAAAPPEPATAAAAAPAPSSGDFVDLGSLLFDEDAPRVMNTRMRIEEEEPTGDEERDFAEMLSAFKKGIEENLADEDWQAHYDLGIAFKEMGLLDEAISEFQKALRSHDGRLRTAEALGLCFFEKGQFSVAGTVLRRAVESESGTDESKIALLYWLGRCEEEQARHTQALTYYQRVFSVDIGFQDVQERVKTLAAAAGK